MNGARCHGHEMTGVEEEEKKQSSISRVSEIPASSPEIRRNPAEVDLYSQAKKALCERSPFDSADEVASTSVPTLPKSLANFLTRQSDSRRRHKKSHAAAEKKSSAAANRRKGYNVWAETEEYLRELTLQDIEALAEVSKLSSVAASKCFLIPDLGNVPSLNDIGDEIVSSHLNNVAGVIENGANDSVVKDDDRNDGNVNPIVSSEIENGGNATNESDVVNGEIMKDVADKGDENATDEGVVKDEVMNDANVSKVAEKGDGGNADQVVVEDEAVNGGEAGEVPVKDETLNGESCNEVGVKAEDGDEGSGISVVVQNVNEKGENENGDVKEEEVKTEQHGQAMEIDSVGACDKQPERVEKSCSVSESHRDIHWVLGYSNKISLTSERPLKRRKVIGADAGLEKVLTASPCDGNPSVCHFCCMGDAGKESNHLIVCSSCKVGVHQKCYGVLEDVDASWLCSWCKNNTGVSTSVKPCVLCSKQGGALKPVKSVDNGGSLEFAHMFCCMWMPEVYIEDVEKMEPITNVGKIKETRKKCICNICKVKWGACVRCSNASCRTSFHPLCAREARQRMEIWAKYGNNNVELKAFCSKHSEVVDKSNTPLADPSAPVDKKSNDSNNHMAASSKRKSNNMRKHSEVVDKSNTPLVDPSVPVNKKSNGPNNHTRKSNNTRRIGRRNGDKNVVTIGAPNTNSDKLVVSSRSPEIAVHSSDLKAKLVSECSDGGDLERRSEDLNASGSLNFLPIFKKLIDCGKVDLKDVASEIGLSPDTLSASLADDSMVPDVQGRIVKWLKDNTYLDLLQKNAKMKLRQSFSSMAEFGDSDAASLSESMADPVSVKSVPPRRRTKGGVKILKDKNTISSSGKIFRDSGIILDKIKVDEIISEEPKNLSQESTPDAVEKNLTMPNGFQNSLLTHSPKSEGTSAKSSNCSLLRKGEVDVATIPLQSSSVIANGSPSISVAQPVPEIKKPEAEVPSSYIHPYIQKQLSPVPNGSSEGEVSRLEASSHASVCCNHQSVHPKCCDTSWKFDEIDIDQMAKARKMGVLEMSPEDEVEGELIYYQHRLQNNAIVRKCFTEVLMCNIAKSLPKEIEAARNQKWDAVLVNQYLCELREAKKQGRKERRHKEAQAVLAAATAAAAASSRISSFRKDVLDEPAHQENVMKLITSSGRSGFSSQLMQRPKETFPRVAAPRISVEKHSGAVHAGSDISKEHSRSCDICRRSETMLNPILVCSSCKVAVHSDCYRSARESSGPWYCELCEEKTGVNFWEKEHLSVECGLCGGKTGAFRKSSDGQWIHAFCAEWIFESTFKRGQVSPIDGVDKVAKGIDFCYICRRKCGICIKCSYGHCQATFHPSCGRNSDFYMTVRTLSGKQQHKAYCQRHSLEQRAKAETQKHGMEELKNLHIIRAELERLRLICERIIKREKVKRELLICSHDLLAVKRDQAARSVPGNGPFLLPDASSESATTSLKGNTDDYVSCSEAIQRSDDVTVDSIVTVKRRTRIPITIDKDRRTDDDSSTSQNHSTEDVTERLPFSEKQIPYKHSSTATCNTSEDGGYRSKSRKHAETFSKEVVMTSDQASVKNMLLPKGYAYVPADCIPKEKQVDDDACSGDQPGDG